MCEFLKGIGYWGKIVERLGKRRIGWEGIGRGVCYEMDGRDRCGKYAGLSRLGQRRGTGY
jgi:hypothetical protein